MRERITLKDGSSFPVIDSDDDIIWRAIHSQLSPYDKQRLAGIADVYLRLVNMPLYRSREKLSMLKKALRETTKSSPNKPVNGGKG